MRDIMPIWVAYLPKLLLQLGLLLIFLFFFGLSSIQNYLEGKVLTVESKEETGGAAAPAITLCAKDSTSGPWKEEGGLEAALDRCSGVENVFTCMKANAWQREDVVTKAVKGRDKLKKRLEEQKYWNQQFIFGNWDCQTFVLNEKIGTDTHKDEIFFYLNRSMLYTYYIHGPDYFIQNYNPLALPNNYGKLFPSKDCNSYFTLALTERRELNTKEDPCELRPGYSFVSCIEESIAEQVGCVLEGGKAKSEKDQCHSVDQYRFLEINFSFHFNFKTLCCTGHIINCTRTFTMQRT